MVAVEAGVEGEEFIEHRGEQEQVPFAQVAVLVHGQFGTHAANRQAAMQAVDVLVGDLLQAAEHALADLERVLVVVARQVVGLEDDLERLDVGQRQVVQRHVGDQLPQVVAVQRRRIARRHRADIAEAEELRGVLAGQADVARLELARQALVGAGQLDRQGLLRIAVARAEAQPGFQAVAEQRGLLAQAVVRTGARLVEAAVVLERLERHVFLVAHAARFPAGHPIHREHPAVPRVEFGRQQQVLVLFAVQADRDGVVGEQVDHRRAVQAHVVQGRADALQAGLADIEAQLQAAGALQHFGRLALQCIQALELDEQELVLEGEVFLQVAIAAEGVVRVGNQRVVFAETDRLDLVRRQSYGRQRQAVFAGQRLALAIQQHQLQTAEVAQQAEVEQLGDIALAGQVQAQGAQADLAEMAIGAHAQAQAEQRAVTLHRIVQAVQRQRQHFARIGGAEAAGHSLDGLGFHRRVARHRKGRAGALERVELQHAEGRQRAHVVGPQQVHQRMGQLRQFVVELLPQTPGKKGEAFQQALDIRITPGLAEERRQRRAALGEALAQLAQGGEFALVVVVERHSAVPCW